MDYTAAPLTQSDDSLLPTQPFSTQDLSQSERTYGMLYSISPKVRPLF